MKKIIALILSLLLLISVFSGCAEKRENAKLSVVTTIFPIYDFVKNIMGEKSSSADITMLLDSGVDLHSFTPSASDIVKISNCDMFIFVGGESDEWAYDNLKSTNNKNMKVLNLMDLIGDNKKQEELVEGMEAEQEEKEDESEIEYDEHIWLSVKNAKIIVEKITAELMGLDTENAGVYETNKAEYIKKLDEIDAEFSLLKENAVNNTLVFGDRFPFRYLANDYGIKYYAAFSGCSAESEASFNTVKFLSDKINELKLPAVMTLEGGNNKIAETVKATTKREDLKILTVNSMQSITKSDVDNGADYITIMKNNYKTIKEALS